MREGAVTSGFQGVGLGFGPFGPVPSPVPLPDRASLSIAVLPIASASTDANEEALADAMTDDLITDLSRISNATVIGRSTMFTYKGRAADTRELGRDLNVRHVVEGTLRRVGERFRLNIHLVDTTSGAQTWAERIEQPVAAWTTMSGVVSGRIARTLNLQLMQAASSSPAQRWNSATTAGLLAMRGWVELFNKPQTAETNRAAMACLTEAQALNEDLPLLWTGIAYARFRAARFGWDQYSHEEGLQLALEAARRACELDPNSADAHYVLGQSFNWLGETEPAQAAFESCIALNPNHAPAHAGLGQARMYLGFPEETASYCSRALALSPREPLRTVWHWTMALAALLLDDARTAAGQAQSAIASNPKHPSAYFILAVARLRLGDPEAARQALDRYVDTGAVRTIAELRHQFGRPRSAQYSALFEPVLADLRRLGMPEG